MGSTVEFVRESRERFRNLGNQNDTLPISMPDYRGKPKDTITERASLVIRNIFTDVCAYALGEEGNTSGERIVSKISQNLGILREGLEAKEPSLFNSTVTTLKIILKADLADSTSDRILALVNDALGSTGAISENSEKTNSLLDVAMVLLDSDTKEHQLAAICFLTANFDRIHTLSSQHSGIVKKLGLFLQFGNQEQKKKVRAFVDDEIATACPPREAVVDIVAANLESNDRDNRNFADRQARAFLTKILSAESLQTLIGHWKQEGIWDNKKYLKRNLKTLSIFESSSQGIAEFMVCIIGMRFFSIVSFPSSVAKEELEYLLTKYDKYKVSRGENYDPWEEEKNLLKEYGVLKSDEFINAWKDGCPRFIASAIRTNISQIIELEKERPGIVTRLSQAFGVKYFARYPKDLLIRQDDEVNQTDIPYVLALFPRNDRNGAFSRRLNLLQKLDQQLQCLIDEEGRLHRYALRVFEAGSKIDIGRMFIKLKKRYGKKRKISAGIPFGHGNIDLIHCGKDKPIHYLKSDDLEGNGSQKVRKLFEENPTFIFASCKTGVSGGIAQRLSKVMDATTIAPDTSTRISAISARVENGKLVFEVKYKKGRGNVYVSGVSCKSGINKSL